MAMFGFVSVSSNKSTLLGAFEMNRLFLGAFGGLPGVTLKIGSRNHGRRVHLTEDEARKLAYRLMALASGGETQGMEMFP
jgi:hypothetical protein